MFDAYDYSFRFIDLEKKLVNVSNESNHISKFTVLVVAAFTKITNLQKKKKEERKRQRQ